MPLLAGVSVELHAGEHLFVTGASGAGKTLLLRAISLLDPIDEGEIRWHRERVTHRTIRRFRSRILYLPQRASLLADTVEADLRRPFELKVHAGSAFDRARVLHWLGRLGKAPRFLDQKARDLSGGEVQIVTLVRSLQLDPSVLLLDEPTAALDAGSERRVEELLSAWLDAELGERALLWVSHDRGQLERLASREVVIAEGRLHEPGDRTMAGGEV